jgi:hypothetical protein
MEGRMDRSLVCGGVTVACTAARGGAYCTRKLLRPVAALQTTELMIVFPANEPRPAVETVMESTMEDMIDQMAAQYLNITGQEFRHRWYGGIYDLDQRDEVRALDQLMRTGSWGFPTTAARDIEAV